MATADWHSLDQNVQRLIFPHLHLQGLLAAEGVCVLWKAFVWTVPINPTRRALFDLYKETVVHPQFGCTRSWLEANLLPFDREAYINAILDQHHYVPEDFRLYILEWPARAVMGCIWPGLPTTYRGPDEVDGIEAIEGCNSLGHIPPTVHKITLRLGDIRALVIASDGREATKALFDSSPLEDQVLVLPVLLLWELSDQQNWLTLDPASPFAVYIFAGGKYRGDHNSTQYKTWMDWLRARISAIDKPAHSDDDDDDDGLAPRRFMIDDEIVTSEQWFRSRPTLPNALWTPEDEIRTMSSTAAV